MTSATYKVKKNLTFYAHGFIFNQINSKFRGTSMLTALCSVRWVGLLALFAPDDLDAASITRGAITALREAPGLTALLTIEEEGVVDGKTIPLKKILEVRLWSTARKLRLELRRPGTPRNLLTFIDDGQRLIEVGADGRTRVSDWVPPMQRSLHSIESDLACTIGSLLGPLVGDASFSVDFLEQVLRGASVYGVENVDDRNCFVLYKTHVAQEHMIVREWRYIDAQNRFVRRRKATQIVYAAETLNLTQEITRIWTYRDLRLESVPPDVFQLNPDERNAALMQYDPKP